MYSDPDAPVTVIYHSDKAICLKHWQRRCLCGWYLDITDLVKPNIANIPCPNCKRVTTLEEVRQ